MKKTYQLPLFQGEVLRLDDSDYYFFAIESIRKATKRILVVMFIIDLEEDQNKRVTSIIDACREASWKNLDVRVIIGNSKKSKNIEFIDGRAFTYIQNKGIDIRYGDPADDASLHSKYIIVDEGLVILGSHNWADLAFSKSKQTSVAIKSEDNNHYFTTEFEWLWSTSANKAEVEANTSFNQN